MNKELSNTSSTMQVPHKKTYKIAEHFTNFLQPCLAINQALTEEAFKIRHHVYCEEFSFENQRANGQETDEFDLQSLFSLIKHKKSDTFTSCVRLVMAKKLGELLPIEKYCLNSITDQSLSPTRFNRNEIAEISRLAVKSDFRRRRSDNHKGSGVGVISENTYSKVELRCFPFIVIGLYMAAATMCINMGIRHVYVMMEPKLARSMRFTGINFKMLGKPINYKGLRAPYYINPEMFMNNLAPEFKDLFAAINKDIGSQLHLIK